MFVQIASHNVAIGQAFQYATLYNVMYTCIELEIMPNNNVLFIMLHYSNCTLYDKGSQGVQLEQVMFNVPCAMIIMKICQP